MKTVRTAKAKESLLRYLFFVGTVLISSLFFIFIGVAIALLLILIIATVSELTKYAL